MVKAGAPLALIVLAVIALACRSALSAGGGGHGLARGRAAAETPATT